MEVAKFNKRILSYLIDIFLALLVGAGLSVLLFLYTPIPWYFDILIMFLMTYFVFVLFNSLLMFLTRGRTIGAFIFGIQTISINNNEPISFRNSLIKNLYLGVVPFVAANAIYMVIIHTEKTVFDRITESTVIDLKSVR